MIYLGNNHVGFDPTDLTYPAIAGCHGICYVTGSGLFGLHNMGGAEKEQWDARAEAFASFVSGHPSGAAAGVTLYGTCFATGDPSRGYNNDKSIWLGELKAFAKKLKFKGPIWGFDMGPTGRAQPVNVRYGKVGTTCVIQLKQYSSPETIKSPNANPTHHKLMRKAPGLPVGKFQYILQQTESTVVTSIPAVGWQTVYPEKLR